MPSVDAAHECRKDPRRTGKSTIKVSFALQARCRDTYAARRSVTVDENPRVPEILLAVLAQTHTRGRNTYVGKNAVNPVPSN